MTREEIERVFDEPWTREGLLHFKATLESGQSKLFGQDRTNALAFCEDELRRLEGHS